MSEKEIIESILGHDARNTELLKSLDKKGLDLYKERSIEHHFWAWSQRDAVILAKELYDLGYLLLMLAPAEIEDDHSRWNIEARIHTSPAHAANHDLSEKLVRLSAKHNCVYDGWGARI